MSHLPLDPALARSLLAARELNCTPEMLTVAAMLSAESIFLGGRPDVPSQHGGGEGPQHGQQRHCSQKGRELLLGLMEHVSAFLKKRAKERKGRGFAATLDCPFRPRKRRQPTATDPTAPLLGDMQGFGDHVLLLRVYETWARSGFDRGIATEMGLDLRGLR